MMGPLPAAGGGRGGPNGGGVVQRALADLFSEVSRLGAGLEGAHYSSAQCGA